MSIENIKTAIDDLKVGNRVRINDWEEDFMVYGVSENFVVLHSPEFHEYTIISKKPTDYTYNGIQAGAYVCAADSWLFGYIDGYHFEDPEWVEKYLGDLEGGHTEMSVRRRTQIERLYIVGN